MVMWRCFFGKKSPFSNGQNNRVNFTDCNTFFTPSFSFIFFRFQKLGFSSVKSMFIGDNKYFCPCKFFHRFHSVFMELKVRLRFRFVFLLSDRFF